MAPLRIIAVVPLLAALATAKLPALAASSADALRDIAREATGTFHQVQRDDDQSLAHDHVAPGSDPDDGGLAEMQPAALALTNSTVLVTAMEKLAAELAERDQLMQRLALCQDGDAKDGVVVCALARAVHAVLMNTPRTADDGRPAALAALLRWDSLGGVRDPSDRRVDAADVRGVSLLLGQPGGYAVAGIAAFAFRALETCGMAPDAGTAGEPSVVENWTRLVLAADAAGDALSVPAARCLLLLLGSTKYGYDAARAAAASAEVALCRFAVRGHAAMRALAALRPGDNASGDHFRKSAAVAQNAAESLIKLGQVFVGPVLGDEGSSPAHAAAHAAARAAARAAGSAAGVAYMQSATGFVSTLLREARQAHSRLQAERFEFFEELIWEKADKMTIVSGRNDEHAGDWFDALDAEELLAEAAAEAAAAAEQAERMPSGMVGARVQVGAGEQVAQQVAREGGATLEGMVNKGEREVGSRLLAIFGGDVQQPGAAAKPGEELTEAQLVPVAEHEQLQRRTEYKREDGLRLADGERGSADRLQELED